MMISEELFAGYLDKHRIRYERNHPVANGNVDFRIERGSSIVLCDVKEVRDSKKDRLGKLDAGDHIRKDIRELRGKFKKDRPDQPIILVTINFSASFFTGFTVATALLGDAGVDFNKDTLRAISPFHHFSKGNAALTSIHNRSISGVLVFDIEGYQHHLFKSPFADHPVPSELFPEVRVVDLSRGVQECEFIGLSNIMFFRMENGSTRPNLGP